MNEPFPREHSQTDTAEPDRVVAALNYLAPDASAPVSYATEPPPGVPWENCEYVQVPSAIVDARTLADRPRLDREGFALFDAPTRVGDFDDEESVRRHYYPEASELALAATGAKRAYVFDHLVRRRTNDNGALNFGRATTRGQAGANGRVHNDYTEASGLRRLGMVVTDEAARQRVGRYAIVNIWRSIKAAVLDTPLAILDARSVDVADLVVSEVRYARRVGEIFLLRHSPAHRWAYHSAMERHEALVFKQFDSRASGVSRFTPHAAFVNPIAPPDAVPRESIELRCLVTYD